jgi:hypothetical protein
MSYGKKQPKESKCGLDLPFSQRLDNDYNDRNVFNVFCYVKVLLFIKCFISFR